MIERVSEERIASVSKSFSSVDAPGTAGARKSLGEDVVAEDVVGDGDGTSWIICLSCFDVVPEIAPTPTRAYAERKTRMNIIFPVYRKRQIETAGYAVTTAFLSPDP